MVFLVSCRLVGTGALDSVSCSRKGSELQLGVWEPVRRSRSRECHGGGSRGRPSPDVHDRREGRATALGQASGECGPHICLRDHGREGVRSRVDWILFTDGFLTLTRGELSENEE